MASIIGKRYGNAMFDIANEGGWVERLEEELVLLRASFDEGDVISFLKHPNVSIANKITVIEETYKGKISDDLIGLICLLIKKGRCEYFDDIFEQIWENIDEYNGKAKVYVSSAYELSDDEKKNLLEKLGTMTKKEIVPIYDVDESLIGGLVIRIGDKVADSSIKGGLNAMKKSLLEDKTA